MTTGGNLIKQENDSAADLGCVSVPHENCITQSVARNIFNPFQRVGGAAHKRRRHKARGLGPGAPKFFYRDGGVESRHARYDNIQGWRHILGGLAHQADIKSSRGSVLPVPAIFPQRPALSPLAGRTIAGTLEINNGTHTTLPSGARNMHAGAAKCLSTQLTENFRQ